MSDVLWHCIDECGLRFTRDYTIRADLATVLEIRIGESCCLSK